MMADTEYSKLQAEGDLDYWRDKAEGLACDLDSAVGVMAEAAFGGRTMSSMKKWITRNYGKHKAVHLQQALGKRYDLWINGRPVAGGLTALFVVLAVWLTPAFLVLLLK